MYRPLKLDSSVGQGFDSRPDDVRTVKTALADLGYYQPDMSGMTEFLDPDLDDGVRRYQKDRGLTIDGWLAPEGETARNIGRDLRGIDPRPKPDDDDFDFGEFGPDRPSAREDVAKG